MPKKTDLYRFLLTAAGDGKSFGEYTLDGKIKNARKRSEEIFEEFPWVESVYIWKGMAMVQAIRREDRHAK